MQKYNMLYIFRFIEHVLTPESVYIIIIPSEYKTQLIRVIPENLVDRTLCLSHENLDVRQMKFSRDGNDADDANDAEIDITQLFKWDISQTASSASLASQRSRKESKHGRSVATGQPAEKPTGTAPNPCEAASA